MGARKLPKVCILAAGKGSRLEEFSAAIHKALLPLENRAIISRIIEQFPPGTEFVIALGFRGEMIKDFLQIAHPGLNVSYAQVDNVDGPGCGPGYSLWCCRSLLDSAFVFTACDTLVSGPLPAMNENWVGVQRVDEVAKWCTVVTSEDSRVVSLHYKEAGVNTQLAFAGIAFVAESDPFWRGLSEVVGRSTGELQVNAGLNALIAVGLAARNVRWADAGDAAGYRRLISGQESSYTFPGKVNEVTYRYDDRIIKFSSQAEIAAARFRRAKQLAAAVPEVLELRGNFFSCRFINGDLLSRHLNGLQCRAFLKWAERSFWREATIDAQEFESLRHEFYVVKTLERLGQFLSKQPPEPTDRQTLSINGLQCQPVSELVMAAFEHIRGGGIASSYHGDLHSDNVIVTNGTYRLIDWRHAFGNSADVGDRYYDLAKFLHTLELSVDTMSRGAYQITVDRTSVRIDHEVRFREIQARDAFFAFVAEHQYDVEQIKLLNGLIFVNMAPLYGLEMGRYLYYHGRYALQEALLS